MIPPLLLDASAWGRLGAARLTNQRSAELAEAGAAGRLVVCLPFLLEVGFSARDGAEHATILDNPLDMPKVEIDLEVESRALSTQRELARGGHHRIPPADLLIAVLADRHGLGVLHYDRHFDRILERTSLRFDSIWLAEPGSL